MLTNNRNEKYFVTQGPIGLMANWYR